MKNVKLFFGILFSGLLAVVPAVADPIKSKGPVEIYVDGVKEAEINSNGLETTDGLKTDTITEKTTDAGVTVEGAILKDGTFITSELPNITPDGDGSGYVMLNGSGYQGFLSLDGDSMWVGHNSASRDLILSTNSAERARITSEGIQAGVVINPNGESPAKFGLLANNTNSYSGIFTSSGSVVGSGYTLFTQSTVNDGFSIGSQSGGDTLFIQRVSDIAAGTNSNVAAISSTGTLTMASGVVSGGDIGVTGSIYDVTDGDVDFAETVSVSGNFYLSGAIYDSTDTFVSVAENLDVAGNIQLSGIIYDSTDSSVNVGENLYVNGTITAAPSAGTEGIYITASGAGYSGILMNNGTAGMYFGQNSNARVLRIGSGSNYINDGVQLNAGANAWSTYSDERIKRDITPLTYGLEQIKSINPIRYNYTYDDEDAESRIGFSAQNLQPLIPEMVLENPTGEKYLTVTSTTILPVLVNAIKELKAEKDSEIAALQAANTTLKTAVVCLAAASDQDAKDACVAAF